MQKINDIVDAKLLSWHQSQEKRNYLGASGIGDDCLRKIQLQYLPKEPEITAQQLRTFDIGHRIEDLVVYWLKISGFDVRTRNEKNEQFGFSSADGKFRGHVDGLIYAFPDELTNFPKAADNRPIAVLEIKTMSSKSWNDTKRRTVLISKPIYHAQVQVYMAYLKIERCLFIALNKDTSELYFEVIPFDSEAAQKYSDRAVQVIKASENNDLLPCISGDPSFYICKMCGFKNECRKNETQGKH